MKFYDYEAVDRYGVTISMEERHFNVRFFEEGKGFCRL